jgi:hypothetical protein
VADAERFPDRLPTLELAGFGPPGDGQVMRRRPQVLPDRDDVTADAGQVGERADQFVVGLTQAHHDPRLDCETCGLGV